MASGEEEIEGPQNRRTQLRNATLILPRTGERVKRVVTLREPNEIEESRDGQADSNGGGETQPLLTRRRSQGAKRSKRRMFQDTSEKWFKEAWKFARSRTGVGILKCSVAYLLGSMGTFFPPFSNFLGRNDGKHMMATVTVYFHPARSLGSMFEAVFIALVAFLYATFVSFTSMGVSIFFDDVVHKIILGHVVVLIVFVGGGLGLVGWTKQALGSPLVNVGCSLTSLAMITVLTKEGAVQAGDFSPDKILQVLKMVSMGVVSTFAVNLLIMPISARKDVRRNLVDVTDSFSDMLATITSGFLNGTEHESQRSVFQDAFSKYKQSQAALGKNVQEAKWEHYASGTEAQHKLEVSLVKRLQQMAQNIGGLRSAAETQFALMEQGPGGVTTPLPSSYLSPSSTIGDSNDPASIDYMSAHPENFATLEAIAEGSDEDRSSGASRNLVASPTEIPALPTARSPSEIFERFLLHLGPSMKSLAYTLKQILDELPCGPAPQYEIQIDSNFRSSLSDAVDMYSDARKQALSLLYRSKDLAASRPEAVEADFEEVAASCGYFSISLLEFAQGVKGYLEILEDLKAQADRPRTWNWLKVWRGSTSNRKKADEPESESTPLLAPPDAGDPQQYSINSPDPEPKNLFRVKAKNRKGTEKLLFRIWVASKFLRRDDIKFAIKTGIGATLYALPSYVPAWRPFYSTWRGEWGLLSYMLVCSMTVGASNTTSSSRIFGTCVGAVCAIVGWEVSDGNVYALAFIGWLMALWNFYIIVGRGNGPFGRFIMLTYNLSALYAYSLSVKDDDHDDDEGGIDPIITEIVLHRVVAVVSGCLWGMVITRLVWPISARRKFRDGLSLLLLRMGLIWKRDPLRTMSGGPSEHSYLNIQEELQLQKYLSRLESLLTSAGHEFRLKGPFAQDAYSRVLKSISSMLDAFHAMNIVITKDPRTSEGEAQILLYTKEEREQLCARISHLFQVLASSLKIEFPLNDALPNTDRARDRLLTKIFKYRKECSKVSGSNDEDYAILYAFALVTGQLSSEIRKVGAELEQLFGVLDEELLSVK